MALLQVSSLLVLSSSLGNALTMCMWVTCNGYEWRDDWSPGIIQGRCVIQYRSAHFSYTIHHGHGGMFCLPSIPCFPKKQHRTMCKYKKQIDHTLKARNDEKKIQVKPRAAKVSGFTTTLRTTWSILLIALFYCMHT